MKTSFDKDKYTIIKGFISSEILGTLASYTLLQKTHAKNTEGIVEGSHEKYGDYFMESLLKNLLPKVEETIQVSVYPTFSLYRVYETGMAIPKQTDNPSSEICVLASLGYEFFTDEEDYAWEICVGDTKVLLEPGDALVYKGHEIEVWSEPFRAQTGWQSYLTLNYVLANGRLSFLMHDGRPDLGHPQWHQDIRRIKHGVSVLKKIQTPSNSNDLDIELEE